MSQIIPIYIPTLISDINFNPAKVYPRLFFYNGTLDCEPYWLEYKPTSGSATVEQVELSKFPYVDHYNVVTGSFPTSNSKSLLFSNENPAYGAIPSGSLYTDYWQTYINLLYNPKTRLINASALIPLADYYKMELNDIVEWRGNEYHLRAINDYDLKTGKCNIQLLGPIIRDTFGNSYDCEFSFTSSNYVPTTTTTTLFPPTTTTTTAGPVSCFTYEYGPAQSGCNIQWVNCDGTPGTTFVAVGQYYTVPCMQEGSGTGCGQWTKGASCGTPPTTTTTTLAPTTTTTSTTTTTTTLAPTTTTTTLASSAVYTVIEGGEVSGGDYTYLDQNSNTITGSLTANQRIFVGTISGSVDISGAGSQIFYSSTPYGTTFTPQSSGCRTYRFQNNDPVYNNADMVAFYVPCGGTSLTYGWISPTTNPDFIDRCISYTGSAELVGGNSRVVTDLGAC